MEEVRQAKYTLETLPTKTLLHYVKKDELIRSLPQGAFAELQRQAAQQGQKMTAKFLKDAVLQNQDFANALRGSQLRFQAYQRYMANYKRITAPEVRAKSQQVRREMRCAQKASKCDEKCSSRVVLLSALWLQKQTLRCSRSARKRTTTLSTKAWPWFPVQR